jgi:DNA-binding transcriptional MerR regulator
MNSASRPPQAILSSAEAAHMLGVERRTLIRMEEAGVLEPIRAYPTAHRRYKREQILSILGAAS